MFGQAADAKHGPVCFIRDVRNRRGEWVSGDRLRMGCECPIGCQVEKVDSQFDGDFHVCVLVSASRDARVYPLRGQARTSFNTSLASARRKVLEEVIHFVRLNGARRLGIEEAADNVLGEFRPGLHDFIEVAPPVNDIGELSHLVQLVS